MSNPIALSWSRISSYRQCPMQFEAKYISKTYPDEGDNPAFEKGTRIHKQLEDYINWKRRKGEGIDPPKLGVEASNAKKLIDNYFNAYSPSAINAEKQIAINMAWEECDWFDTPDVVKFRGIMDMIVFESPTKMSIIDFKSGKVRPYDEDFGQLHLSATIMFELFPKIETITCAYLFVEHKQTIKEVFERSECHNKNKAHFEMEYLEINEDDSFEAKKNKYCFFCGIKSSCKYG